MFIRGVPHTLSYRHVLISKLEYWSGMSELTDVTVFDLGHYVDFLLAADGFFSVEPHYKLPWEYYE